MLNRVYAGPVEAVLRFGGSVSSFLGAAFVALFPDDPGHCAISAALATQRSLAEFRQVSTPYGGFELAARIGISRGRVDWMEAGSGARRAYAFLGDAARDAVAAEQQAHPGEIVLDAAALDPIPRGDLIVRTVAPGFHAIESVRFAIEQAPLAQRSSTDQATYLRYLPQDIVAADQLEAFRPVAAAFVSIGLGRDTQRAIEIAVDQADQYGGFFNSLESSEKRCLAWVVFGAPTSRGDDAQRAARYASELRRAVGDAVRVGLASGGAYAGVIGAERSRSYTV